MKIGYARVSKSLDHQNPQAQIDELNRYGCERIFTEHASGAKADRPQLNALLEYARDGDTVVVWKLDRLARSLKQLIQSAELFDQRDIGLVSLTESMDTTTPGGKLIFHVFGALAEFERSIIRERTNAGLRAARAQGRTGGRPPAMDSADVISAQALLAENNMSFKAVAERIGVSPSTLYRYLPGGRVTPEPRST